MKHINYNDNGFIKSNIDKYGIASITFHHPSHNSFTRKQLDDLSKKIDNLGDRSDVKVILLQSQGNKSFCAGASFDELLTIKTKTAGKDFFSGFAHVINSIRISKKLIICKVQGIAIGGGVGLLAACDYCFATAQASIRLSELNINMGPFVIAPAVERKIGLSALAVLTLNPNDYKNAEWAKVNGLFQEVYPDLITMNSAVQLFCERLSNYNHEVLAEIKSMFWQGTEHWGNLLFERAEISGKVVLNKETKTSLLAFKNKNKDT